VGIIPVFKEMAVQNKELDMIVVAKKTFDLSDFGDGPSRITIDECHF